MRGRNSGGLRSSDQNFIYAPYEDRIVNCVNDLGMDTKAAKRMIRDVDKERCLPYAVCGVFAERYEPYGSDGQQRNSGVDMTARLLAEVVRDKFS